MKEMNERMVDYVPDDKVVAVDVAVPVQVDANIDAITNYIALTNDDALSLCSSYPAGHQGIEDHIPGLVPPPYRVSIDIAAPSPLPPSISSSLYPPLSDIAEVAHG